MECRGEAGAIEYVLRDGTLVLVRPVRSEDRRLIAEAFAKLSEATRHQRFFRGIVRLSDADLDYLTLVDQVDHVAWGARDLSRPDRPGVGLGRFKRLAADPRVAEVAYVVADSHTRRGFGTVLLAALMLRAEQVGVEFLRSVVLPDNEPVLHWMHQLGAAIFREDGLACEFDLPTRTPAPSYPHTRAAVRLEEAKSDLRALIAGGPGGPEAP